MDSKNICPACMSGFAEKSALLEHLNSKQCSALAAARVSLDSVQDGLTESCFSPFSLILFLLDTKLDSDLAELESITFVSISKNVQKGTISSDDVCKSCGEVFTEALERKVGMLRLCFRCLMVTELYELLERLLPALHENGQIGNLQRKSAETHVLCLH